MLRSSLKILIFSVLAALAGCEEGGLDRSGIRPGIGQSFDLSKAGHHDGNTASYLITGDRDRENVQTIYVYKTKQISENVFDHQGKVHMTFKGVTPAALKPAVEQIFGGKGFKYQIRGNTVITDHKFVTDRRGATIIGGVLGYEVKATKTSCFAIVGTCRFSGVLNEKTDLHYWVETKESGGIWSSVIRRDPTKTPNNDNKIVAYQVYSVAEDGFVIDQTTKIYIDGNPKISNRKRIE